MQTNLKRRQSLRGVAHRRYERGATLAESLVALTVVTIGILGFFSFHVRASETLSVSVALSDATNLAASLQDSLLAVPFTGSATLPSVLTPCSAGALSSVDDLCTTLAPTTPAGATPRRDAETLFYPSYQVEQVGTTRLKIRVRVRYPALHGRCSDSGDPKLSMGWKAVTLTSMRYAATTIVSAVPQS